MRVDDAIHFRLAGVAAGATIGASQERQVQPRRRYRVKTDAPIAVHDGRMDSAMQVDDLRVTDGDEIVFESGSAVLAARTSFPTRVWLVPIDDSEGR